MKRLLAPSLLIVGLAGTLAATDTLSGPNLQSSKLLSMNAEPTWPNPNSPKPPSVKAEPTWPDPKSPKPPIA